MVTIKDVAARANVSIATVSNYLNQTKPVSRATAARIKEAVEALQYSQNQSAKSLKTNSYPDIGVVLPNLNDSYYVQIFQGIESVFQDSPYYLNLAFSYDIPEIEQNIIHNMLRKQISGLLLVSCQPDSWKFYYENFNRHHRPIVLLDRAIHNLDASLIALNNRDMIRDITRQLISCGYSRIALLSGPPQYTCENACIQGFLDAHQEAGKSVPPSALLHTDLNKEDAFRKVTALLKADIPEVILTTSELTATGIIEGLRVLGYTTEELPVITLGEEHWNQHTQSFATYSTARPAMRLGTRSAQLLMNKLRSPLLQESEQIILDGRLPNRLSKVCRPMPLCRAAASPPAPDPDRTIRLLMLDSPSVHTFCSLVHNFEIESGIHAEFDILPHHHLYEAIEASHSANHPDVQYDVYMYDIPWLPQLASRGILSDLSDFLEAMDTSVFLPGCLQYFSKFLDHYYGIPFMYAPQILYYRKDLFNDLTLRSGFEHTYGSALRPPRTFREFNAVAEYFTSHADSIQYGFSVPAAYDECLAPELYMRLRAYGSRIFDAAGNVLFDTPQTLKAYINFVQAVRLAKPDFRKATDVSIIDDFLSGETAMLISYPAFLTDVSDLRKSSMIGSIGYSHIPGRSPLLGGWGMGISQRSRKKGAAMEFLKWTCSQQMGNYFALLGGNSALTSTYENDELVKLYPWLPLYKSTYSYTSPMLPTMIRSGHVVPTNAIDTIICREVYRVLDQACSIEEAIAATQAKLTEFLHQYDI